MSRQLLNPRGESPSSILRKFGESRNVCAIDTESSKQRGLLGVSLDNGQYNTYLPYNHYDIENMSGEQQQYLRNYMERCDSNIFHNSGYDCFSVLIPSGLLNGWPLKFYDTMNWAHWINENRLDYSLDSVSKSLGIHGKKSSSAFKTIVGMEGDGWGDVPFDLMFEYSANDAEITYDSWMAMLPDFINQGFTGELWQWEQDFIKATARMKGVGIKIDSEMCAREILRGKAIMEECKKDLGLSWRENVGPKALSHLFFTVLGLPVVKRTPKGAPCFDKMAMEKYEEMLAASKNPIAKIVLRYRGWQKTVSANYTAYLKYADGDSVIHPSFKLHGTVTGRISCANPALQQIPRESEQEWNGQLKQAFIPRDGYKLWNADYSQLEFRLIAAYAEEQALLEIFSSERDLFSEMARQMRYPRHQVKTYAYASNYGAQPPKIAQILGISEYQARNLFDSFQNSYPNVVKIRDDANKLARSRGYLKYWTGRRRHFENPREEAHKGFNSIIQGGGAEVVKRALVRVDQEVCNEECRLVLQVHDSIVAEIAEGKESEYLPKIQSIMEDVQYPFGVPFKVDIKPWGE